MKNLINLCDSCKCVVPGCGVTHDILQYGNDIGEDNIICCPLYKPFHAERVITDSEHDFPDRFLTHKERKLLIAKIIKYTSTSISETFPPQHRLHSKLADSNLINLFIENADEETLKSVFISLGADLRLFITNNKQSMLGLV